MLIMIPTGVLGTGSFGKVYSAYREGDPKRTILAVKISTSAGHGNDLLIKEIDIHSRLTHPNIVRYVNSYEIAECGKGNLTQVPTGTGNCAAMVLEFMAGKDIEKQLKLKNFPLRRVQKLGKDMVSALLYLKEQGIVHRDVKLANVFTDENGRFKLGDFGLAVKIEDITPSTLSTSAGTPYYMAAEVLLKTGNYTYAYDMWSLGVLLFYAFHNEFPWDATTLPKLRTEVRVGKITREGLGKEPDSLKDLINQCLTNDPEKRITVEKAVGHDFLKISKSPENLGEIENLRQEHQEFGKGSRTDFYLWLVNKYPDHTPLPWAEFSALYDKLYV